MLIGKLFFNGGEPHCPGGVFARKAARKISPKKMIPGKFQQLTHGNHVKTHQHMNRKSVVRFCVTLIAISILAATSSCSRDRTAAQAGGDGKSGGRGGRGGAGGTGMVLPVGVTAAKTDSFPVYINAIGTASAWNTVTVRSRVDGALMKLHFTEGQRVKAGDMLAEIDPRPYQVQLKQAQGQLARDQALLANAKLDLQRYLNAKAERSLRLTFGAQTEKFIFLKLLVLLC